MRTLPFRRPVTLHFGPELSIRDAIEIPQRLAEIDPALPVIVDLRDVRQARAAAVAALIPSLASLHRKVKLLGLDHLISWSQLPLAAAA